MPLNIVYMTRKNVSPELITETIDKLVRNKLLDDERFAKAFLNDKLNFTEWNKKGSSKFSISQSSILKENA